MPKVETIGDLFEQVMRDRVHLFRQTLGSFESYNPYASLSLHLPAVLNRSSLGKQTPVLTNRQVSKC